MRHFGVPEWLLKLAKDIRDGTFHKVMIDGSLNDTFEIKSGVIRGGILSFSLLFMVIDCTMKKVASETNTGIVCWNKYNLVDLNFADDIVLAYQ